MTKITCFCSRHSPNLLASQLNLDFMFLSACFVLLFFMVFMLWNACVFFQSKSLVLLVVFVDISGRRGAESVFIFGMRFIKWCGLLMNDLSCFNVFGTFQ